MDFEISPEQQQLADALNRYLDKEYSFEARNRLLGSPQAMSETAWQVYAELGLLALPLAEEHGGFGGGAADMMSVMEVIGAARVLEPCLSTLLCARLLARSGNAGLQAELLPQLAEGKLKLAFAHQERGARYLRSHVNLRAVKDGDGWLLNGEKCAVVHGGVAERLLVSARVEGEAGSEQGLVLFVLDPRAPGVRRKVLRNVDGTDGCDLMLENVRLGADALLGQPGSAFPLIDEALDYASALASAEAVGLIGWCNAQTLDYIKTRRQYGKAIGSFQVLQHKMVELMIAHEQAKSMACLACVKVDTEPDARERARCVSAARIRIIDACRQVSQDTVQMHGGMGMTEEMKLSHGFRRLLVLQQMFGDHDFHMARFAAMDDAIGIDPLTMQPN
jgi:alkylation response protein AidB-like acyl-CoA dehydrogenase